MKSVSLAIGIFAHNEENNITRAITSVQKQSTEHVVIKEIIVVSSGSYDRTNARVRALSKQDKRIRLIEEPQRRGKSAAINLFLHAAHSPVVITMSADLHLHRRALEEIGIPFLQPDVGMVGGHPVPVKHRGGQLNKEIAILWELHHQISLLQPKCGEVVAFRNIIREIPHESAVDEATIEVLLRLLGYVVVYAPRSIVYNKGPRTIKEFLIQRRRVQAGHQWVYEKYNYPVVTMKAPELVRVVAGYLLSHPAHIIPLTRLIALEAMARFLGLVDYYLLGRNPYVWQMIKR